MLLTTLTTTSASNLQGMLTGQQQLGSSGGGGILGTILGLALGIFAVMLNYRRNRSIFYAILAFLFSEVYLAYVLVALLFAKFNIQ